MYDLSTAFAPFISEYGYIPPRKTITIFRYKWGKRRRQIIHGEVLAGWFSHANGVYVDWATQEYTYSAQNLHIWPDDDDAIIPWNQCEIFELTDDEVLRHVVMEQI